MSEQFASVEDLGQIVSSPGRCLRATDAYLSLPRFESERARVLAAGKEVAVTVPS
jgi:hypothetical protein